MLNSTLRQVLLGIICLGLITLPNLVIAQTDKNKAESLFERWLEEGNKLYEKGKYQEAIESYKEAIRIKPDFAEAHYNLGLAYYYIRRYPEDPLPKELRNKDWDKLAETDPRYVIAVMEIYGEVLKEYNKNLNDPNYGKLGDWERARDSFKAAIRIKPDYAEAHYNLGLAYGKLEDYENEIESYKGVIRIKPDYAEAHYNLGLTYITVGERSSALEEYKILKGLNKELADKLFNLIYADEKKARPIIKPVVPQPNERKSVKCLSCKGTGLKDCSMCQGTGLSLLPCYGCDGSGKSGGIRCFHCGGRGFGKCERCDGKGLVKCSACDGKGNR